MFLKVLFKQKKSNLCCMVHSTNFLEENVFKTSLQAKKKSSLCYMARSTKKSKNLLLYPPSNWVHRNRGGWQEIFSYRFMSNLSGYSASNLRWWLSFHLVKTRIFPSKKILEENVFNFSSGKKSNDDLILSNCLIGQKKKRYYVLALFPSPLSGKREIAAWCPSPFSH